MEVVDCPFSADCVWAWCYKSPNGSTSEIRLTPCLSLSWRTCIEYEFKIFLRAPVEYRASDIEPTAHCFANTSSAIIFRQTNSERERNYGSVCQSYSVYRPRHSHHQGTIKRGEVAMAEAEKMDSVTRAAIARYQQEHGLYMTSAVDESTLAALGMNEFG